MCSLLLPNWQVLYLGDGYFNIHGESTRVTRVNLIGGGTGITPLWQVWQQRHSWMDDCACERASHELILSAPLCSVL
jgi:hypothetical protein